ncbi:hypothetical protein [Sandaracinus amylolyticus]|uniref:Uncharacterized protein n=1 Tax=Sandaracinus amylolyticus TaxID=927083 RepID=A0A0F6W9W3_9BACT|nr:hypothetical protein [Sandaracinus amylolyticus]AKF11162.1 hypothetical protein DB32_008311 [Sandaracinus amylolyticus]
MRCSSLLVVLAVVLSIACGGPRMREGELFAGRPSGPPSMASMPDPDVVDEELSPRMRRAMELARDALDIAAPEPARSRAALDLTEWSEGALREWLERKTAAIEAARTELDAAAEEQHRQRILAGALVGLLYEDVLRVLRRRPMPDDLEDEPEILDVYRDSLESQARPWLETARRAYRACAANAREPESMRHFVAFCEAREMGLPSGMESGESTVEVIRD